jgi:CarD family transcriptional regulator
MASTVKKTSKTSKTKKSKVKSGPKKSVKVKKAVKKPVARAAAVKKPVAKAVSKIAPVPVKAIKNNVVPANAPKEPAAGANKEKYRTGVKVVYPSHGVGEIKGIETHIIAGTELKTFVIEFEKEKMLLRIPANRAERSGLRTLSSDDELKTVRSTLLERPRSSRGMWSRRAKEYETKINSGNIISVAEVVRDLHKNVDDPERSYSERVIYENALERLSREVSAVKKMDISSASDYLVKTINDNNPYFIKKAAAKKAAADAEVGEDSIAA